MSVSEIVGLVSTLTGIISTIVIIFIALGNKKRAKAGVRNALLTKLRCKKDEMNRRENKIYYLIELFKNKVITKVAFDEQVSHEYEQLKLVYREYKQIKLELNSEDLKTEKEDYSKSMEHIDAMIIKLTGKE